MAGCLINQSLFINLSYDCGRDFGDIVKLALQELKDFRVAAIFRSTGDLFSEAKSDDAEVSCEKVV